MQTTLSITAETNRQFINSFQNNYDKDQIRNSLSLARTLDLVKGENDTIKVVVDHSEYDQGKYLEHTSIIVNNLYRFNFNDYRETWSYMVDKRYDTQDGNHAYLADKEQYGLPKNLGKMNKKKFQQCLEYLGQCKFLLEEAEQRKQENRNNAQTIVDELMTFKGAISHNPKFERHTESVCVYFDNMAVKVSRTGSIQTEVNDYKENNQRKIELIKLISNF